MCYARNAKVVWFKSRRPLSNKLRSRPNETLTKRRLRKHACAIALFPFLISIFIGFEAI